MNLHSDNREWTIPTVLLRWPPAIVKRPSYNVRGPASVQSTKVFEARAFWGDVCTNIEDVFAWVGIAGRCDVIYKAASIQTWTEQSPADTDFASGGAAT